MVKQLNNTFKKILAVASGKGGVGKSTVAVNLSLLLAQAGYRVGLLDADIYGPSVPFMLGAAQHDIQIDSDTQALKPLVTHAGLKINSIGLLVPPDSAVIWRGPMVSDAVKQLFNRTDWGDLDYLIIDLPPGTGDIQLTMAQKIPVTSVLMVTTPQLVAAQDVSRAIQMFLKLKIPVLGLIENHLFPNVHNHLQAGILLSKQFDLPMLGQLNFNPKLFEQADLGHPIVLSDDLSDRVDYQNLCAGVLEALSRQKLAFPAVKIKES